MEAVQQEVKNAPMRYTKKTIEEEEKEVSRFYKNSMKVSNVESIEDIVEGEEWQSWFDTIINNPEQAPSICKRHCDDE